MPKKIVYLLGSGATHAVIREIDITKGLLTKDIQDYVGKTFSSRGIEQVIWNELTQTKDVEHLISVLDFQHKRAVSEKLRSYYRSAIIALAASVSYRLPANLYTVLCDLHIHLGQELCEELVCFLTLNYEDILERSIKMHLEKEVSYGFADESRRGNDRIEVLKLHGSFTWKSTYPIEIGTMTSVKNSTSLWIPPGVDKRKDNYPFNLIWGRATEALMGCDVLRIIGCSLSRNDWALIPIIYTLQKFRDGDIRIEVIDFPDIGKNIKSNYGYLDITIFSQLEEVIHPYRFLFPTAGDKYIQREIESVFRDKNKTNPFKTWLENRIEALTLSKIDLRKAKFAHEFFHKVS